MKSLIYFSFEHFLTLLQWKLLKVKNFLSKLNDLKGKKCLNIILLGESQLSIAQQQLSYEFLAVLFERL